MPTWSGRCSTPRTELGSSRSATLTGTSWASSRPDQRKSPPDLPSGCSLESVAAPGAGDDGAVEVGGELRGGWLEMADGVTDPCAHRLAGPLGGGRPELGWPGWGGG